MKLAFFWKHGLLALLLLLVPLAVSAQEVAIEPVELRIMTFNIWIGGEVVNFGKIVEAIQAADADIVGLQEAEGNVRRIADALGWQYANERMQIISHFPLIDPPDGDGKYIFAQIAPGEVVALANVHLPSGPYGPEAVRDGAALDEVLELEREARLPFIEPVLESVSPLIDAGTPVLLTGDFNTPSHHDWTEAMVAERDQVKYPVDWPVTIAVETAGFQDTFRIAHPDPVENPGITWTYGYPYPRLKPDEVIDRIDLVFASNGIEILDSKIVGPAGSPNADIEIEPYGSDHRAVVSTVRLTPVVPPVFAAVTERAVSAGESIVVRYHAPGGEDTDRIAIVAAGGSINDVLMWLPPQEASFFGAVTFGSWTLPPGEYAAILIGLNDEELSRSQFWVVDPNAIPSVTTEKTTYPAGEPIVASWENAPALRWDWLGIYAAGDPDLYNNYLGFIYTEAAVSGTITFDAEALGDEMLPPGEYVVRLMKDDGYQVLAETGFTITE